MSPKITEKELNLLDAHLLSVEQILVELKKKSYAIRQSLSLTEEKPPSKYMLRKAQVVAQANANFDRYMRNQRKRAQQKANKTT